VPALAAGHDCLPARENQIIPNVRGFLSSLLAPGEPGDYRAGVNADEREEIAASVAAHAELGPHYDAALAEGLIERIGEEIDRRVDARLRGMDAGGTGAGHRQAAPRQGSLSPGHRIVPPGYPGAAAYGPPTGAAPAAPASPQVTPRRNNGVTGMILGLGSLGIGIGATAAVVSHHVDAVAQVLIVLVVWLAIVVVNIAHSQRR
jgi:hypothetical protein